MFDRHTSWYGMMIDFQNELFVLELRLTPRGDLCLARGGRYPGTRTRYVICELRRTLKQSLPFCPVIRFVPPTTPASLVPRTVGRRVCGRYIASTSAMKREDTAVRTFEVRYSSIC